MRRVAEGEEIGDRDRLDARFDELPHRRENALLVERGHDLARRRDALAYLLAELAGREEDRRLGLEDDPVESLAPLPADLKHVLESRRREEPEPRALAFEDGVGRDRG